MKDVIHRPQVSRRTDQSNFEGQQGFADSASLEFDWER